jgi:hypothetical protein
MLIHHHRCRETGMMNEEYYCVPLLLEIAIYLNATKKTIGWSAYCVVRSCLYQSLYVHTVHV